MKRKSVATILSVQLLIGADACEPSFGGGGLVVSVVDKENNGVQSEIFEFSGQRDVSELKIGTTDPHGLLSDNNYRCRDRNLVAKPVDRTYFDSPAQPCKSPEKLLVVSRLTPDGHVSFGGILRAFRSNTGDSSQLAYKATIKTTESHFGGASGGMQMEGVEHSGCTIDYKVDVDKSRFVLQQDKWEQVKESSEPASKVVTLTTSDIEKALAPGEDWRRNIDTIRKTDAGFILFTKSQCIDARVTVDNVQNSIERAYVVKFDSGDFNEKNVQSFETDER